MNAKELYLAIGQISDDLILMADAKLKKNKTSAIRVWAIAAAACFCLMLGGAYLHFFGTFVVWNEGAGDFISKYSVPENSFVQTLTNSEFSEYYRASIPDMPEEFSLIGTNPQIYTDSHGKVLYDKNTFRYESADGEKGINLTFSRVSAKVSDSANTEHSRIRGVTVTLTEDNSIPGYLMLSAHWEHDGTTVYLSAEGINKDELIAILKKII